MNRTSPVAVMVLAGLLGCQPADRSVNDPLVSLQSTPDDPAMELRDDWDTAVVEYPNGGTVSGNTLYPVTADEDSPEWQQALVNPALFIGQTVLLPFTIFTAPATVVSQGVDAPDTDTAVLPLTGQTDQLPQPTPDRPLPAAAPSDVPPVETPSRQVPESVPTDERTTPTPRPAVTPAPSPDRGRSQASRRAEYVVTVGSE